MIWRAFRRSSFPSANETAWWRDANAAVDHVTPAVIQSLREGIAASTSRDEVERQQEMVDALEHLLTLTAPTLPIVHTQHRVIGPDVCHFVAPASLAGEVDSPGKLFVTSRRLIFTGGRVRAWPWHRLRNLVRADRALILVVAGPSEEAQINCNSYGDAIAARYLATRLK